MLALGCWSWFYVNQRGGFNLTSLLFFFFGCCKWAHQHQTTTQRIDGSRINPKKMGVETPRVLHGSAGCSGEALPWATVSMLQWCVESWRCGTGTVIFTCIQSLTPCGP